MLIDQKNSGEINYHQIYQEIKKGGYSKSYPNSYKQLILRIRDNDLNSCYIVTRKQFKKLLFEKPISDLKLDKKAEKLLFEKLQENNNYSVTLSIAMSFKMIMTNQSTTQLDDWINYCDGETFKEWTKTKSFIAGIKRDKVAVINQIQYVETNSTTEGFVSKLKTIKKRTYGRASFACLKVLLKNSNSH